MSNIIYTSTFTFATRQFDAEFHALDDAIAEAARSIPGYLGEQSWENNAEGLVSNVYFWNDLHALRTLIRHPVHQKAKQLQDRWLNGYEVTISRVMRQYGDGRIRHPLSQPRSSTP
jgi:heme-degrading monooxygenase HmoA